MEITGARQKYHGYLDEEKRKRKKAFTDELEDLKKKRARMEADICALEKSVDEYAEKAESDLNRQIKQFLLYCKIKESIFAQN